MIKIHIRKKLHLAGGNRELQVDTCLNLGSFTAVYGPSGAGKTTLLRIIAGLLQPEEGIIEVNGQTWLNTDKNINLPPQRRNIGFVFQDYALFPNMTIRQNLLFGLTDKAQSQSVDLMLDKMKLQNFAHYKPALLSGGQKQRVALARALVRRPQILLLDEPLSALDTATRLDMQNELQSVHRQYELTTLLVSHYMPEVYKLAGQVIQIDNGRVLQTGTPAKVFGVQQYSNGLTLVGEVMSISSTVIEVIANGQVISISTSALSAHLVVGDMVSIHAADLSLKKLS